MDIENQKVIYCADDEEYTVDSDICDNLCIERFYKNHLKSQSHTTNIYKRQRLKNTNKNNWNLIVFIKVNKCDECYWLR